MRPWWLRIAGYAGPHWRGLAVIGGLMLVAVIAEAAGPWPLKLIIDHVLTGQALPDAVAWIGLLPGGERPAVLVGWLALATVLLFAVRQAVAVGQGVLQAELGTRLNYDLAADLFEHAQRLTPRYHATHPTGDLIRRVLGDTTCARDLVMSVGLPLLTSLTTLAIVFSIMWRLDAPLALVTLLVAFPLGLLIWKFSRPMTERFYRQTQAQGELMSLAERALTSLPVVQAFGREDLEDRRFRDLARRNVRAGLGVTRSQLQFKVGTSAVTTLGTAGIMVLGGLHVLQGTLTVGGLVVFLAYLAALYAPLETLAYLSAGFASAAAGARRVLEVLDAEDEVRDAPGARPLAVGGRPGRGHVCFEGIRFGYEPERAVLEQIDLEARPGETLALVGPTGAGKSTLVSLVPRFFDPWSGSVRFDGVDVREVQLASLRSQIALVLQDPYLLPLTVAENIAYGRPGARREEIEAAARAANAEDFIRRLPGGFESLVGERGETLSGGEKQRLAIARALLKDAPVLILDEPTAALDTETEALVMEALGRLMIGRTTFLIAHRLSTVQRADRICVIDQGRVVESGSHHQLLAAEGHYARLQRAQWAGGHTDPGTRSVEPALARVPRR